MEMIVLDSLWLHVRACGHWTRRVYDLFRVKLQKEHGFSIGETTSNIHLRTSMRSRMSRSYINELRGSNAKELEDPNDMNNNENLTSSIQSDDLLKTKVSSMSLPQVMFHTKLSPSSHSVTTLRDRIKFNSANPSIISATTTCDEKEEPPINTTTATAICKPIIKNNHHLTVPASGDYCLRISNASSSTCDDDPKISQQANSQMILNDSRTSDVLGYLHMYQNNNRIQFSTIQFNDREDLQVK